MKMEEIRSLSDEKIVETLNSLRREQLNFKIQQAAGRLEKPHRVSEIKSDIARVKTEITARKIQEVTKDA